MRTGCSFDESNVIQGLKTGVFKRAHTVSVRFKNLPEYYTAQSSSIRRKKGFNGEKHDFTIPMLDFQSEGTVSIGKAFGFGAAVVGKYRVLVLAVTGELDYFFCGSNTPEGLTGTDSAVAKTATQLLNAKSFNYAVAHFINHALN